MIGSCIIDTVDISAYGAFIERGGSDDFLSFPSRRTPDFNDWAEYDGLDVDLSDLSFEPKKVSVNYVITADDETTFKHRLNSFKTLHYQPGYREIYVREFNKTFELRFVGFSRYKQTGGMIKQGSKRGYLTADYMMDDPMQLYSEAISSPVGGGVNSSYVHLNGVDLSQYGIIVQDAYSTVLKPRSLKEVLTIDSHYRDGQWADADAEDVKKRPQEIVIECAMLANSVSTLMINLAALFNVMRSTQPIVVDAAGATSQCYYSKMTRFRKDAPFRRRVRVSFLLHLQEFSDAQIARLLASENNYVIITENGYAIDLD